MLGSCRSARELLIIILTMSTRPLLCVWPFRIWRCCCLFVSVMIWSAMKYSCHQNTHQTSGFDSPRTVLLPLLRFTFCFFGCSGSIDFFFHQHNIHSARRTRVYRPPCRASGSGSRRGLRPDSGRHFEAAGPRVYSLVLGSPSAFVPAPPAASGPLGPSAPAGSQSLFPEREKKEKKEKKVVTYRKNSLRDDNFRCFYKNPDTVSSNTMVKGQW